MVRVFFFSFWGNSTHFLEPSINHWTIEKPISTQVCAFKQNGLSRFMQHPQTRASLQILRAWINSLLCLLKLVPCVDSQIMFFFFLLKTQILYLVSKSLYYNNTVCLLLLLWTVFRLQNLYWWSPVVLAGLSQQFCRVIASPQLFPWDVGAHKQLNILCIHMTLA